MIPAVRNYKIRKYKRILERLKKTRLDREFNEEDHPRTMEEGHEGEFTEKESVSSKQVQEEHPNTTVSNPHVSEQMDEDYKKAVEERDTSKIKSLAQEALKMARERGATFDLASDAETTSYKLHRGPVPKKTMIVYKAFNVDEHGRPTATYAGVDQPMPYGYWLDAVAQPYVVGADGNKYIPGMTGTAPKLAGLKSPSAYGFKGYTSWLSYRPAFHASTVPAPMQMRIKDPKTGKKTALPHNKLIFRVEVSADKDYQDEAKKAGVLETERRKKYWRENPEYRKAKRESDVEAARKRAEEEGKPFDREKWLKAYDAKGDNVVGSARDQLDYVPDMGCYLYRNQGEDWVLAGNFRILGVCSEEEIRKVNEEHGYPNKGKSQLDWIGGYNPSDFQLQDIILKPGEVPSVGDSRYPQIKLADAITYDDTGEIIPLSKRFDPKSKDPRY